MQSGTFKQRHETPGSSDGGEMFNEFFYRVSKCNSFLQDGGFIDWNLVVLERS